VDVRMPPRPGEPRRLLRLPGRPPVHPREVPGAWFTPVWLTPVWIVKHLVGSAYPASGGPWAEAVCWNRGIC
jgi:hypothetical protein